MLEHLYAQPSSFVGPEEQPPSEFPPEVPPEQIPPEVPPEQIPPEVPPEQIPPEVPPEVPPEFPPEVPPEFPPEQTPTDGNPDFVPPVVEEIMEDPMGSAEDTFSTINENSPVSPLLIAGIVAVVATGAGVASFSRHRHNRSSPSVQHQAQQEDTKEEQVYEDVQIVTQGGIEG